ALERAEAFMPALRALGDEVEQRLGPRPPPSRGGRQAERGTATLDGWIRAISPDTPLVVEIDNVEHAAGASLGSRAALAQCAPDVPRVAVRTLGVSLADTRAIGVSALLNGSSRIELSGLTASDMRQLAGSIFGDAPHVERFSEWLYER